MSFDSSVLPANNYKKFQKETAMAIKSLMAVKYGNALCNVIA